jgi:hypothetical protein
MFAHRFFSARLFAPRYFPPTGAVTPPAPSAGNYVQRLISRSVVFPVADIEELRRKTRQRREEDEIVIL